MLSHRRSPTPPSGVSHAPPLLAVALVSLVALLGTAGLHPPRLHAQGRSLSIERFDVEVRVREDATIDVVEQIRFRFDGSWNGIYRDIPVEYRTLQGFGKRFDLDVQEVLGEDGGPLRYETSRERHYKRVKVWVPGATDASRTVTLHYTVENALLFFDPGDEGFDEGHDELYWNVTGDEWEIPIGLATARVHLPEGVTGTRAVAYTGAYGSTAQEASIEETEDGFYFEATRSFAPGQGLTVAVAWDPGVVERPTAVDRAVRFLAANWLLLIPVALFGVLWRLWDARGRDPRRRPIAVQYDPPEGLSPAEAGALMDHRIDPHDITATLVDLAVRGYLRIEEVDRGGLVGFFAGEEYRFVRTRDAETWKGLPPYEQAVLAGIFGTGGYKTNVDLSDLKNKFYTRLPRIREAVYDRLIEGGHYRRRPDKVRRNYLSAAAVLAFLSLFVGVSVAAGLGIPPVTAGAAGLLSAAVVAGFGLVMPARTRPGTRALEHVLGFEEYMNRVEEDHLRRTITSPDLFEKYLPYAMALQVEERWARAFEGILSEPPDWYVSSTPGSHFRPGSFAGRLSTMSGRTASAMSSAPRSSGGSGFSGGGGGGGFSGGGGGGGGGGGF